MERQEELLPEEANDKPMSGATIIARIAIFMLVVPVLLMYLVKIFVK